MSGRGRGYKRRFDHPSRTQSTTTQSTVQVAHATIYLNEREKVEVDNPRFQRKNNFRGRPNQGGLQTENVRKYRNRNEEASNKVSIPEDLSLGLPTYKLVILEKKLKKAKSEMEENIALTRAYEELEKLHQSREAMEQAKQAALRAKQKRIMHKSPLQDVYSDGKSSSTTTDNNDIRNRKSSVEATVTRNGASQFQNKKYQERRQNQKEGEEQLEQQMDEQSLRDSRLQKDMSDLLDGPQTSPMETQQV